ncbi:hypothetical protein KVT40_008557 [Elsinoe batatas]|uniref:Protein kinase domain-containing protein n=1 Tax=Elsinoe batatas TaxID=2601811 RepID=A0A8K0PBM8_9PEZI|nr:hypothetical protein KVT40_008557 [Elsinoe batatas]
MSNHVFLVAEALNHEAETAFALPQNAKFVETDDESTLIISKDSHEKSETPPGTLAFQYTPLAKLVFRLNKDNFLDLHIRVAFGRNATMCDVLLAEDETTCVSNTEFLLTFGARPHHRVLLLENKSRNDTMLDFGHAERVQLEQGRRRMLQPSGKTIITAGNVVFSLELGDLPSEDFHAFIQTIQPKAKLPTARGGNLVDPTPQTGVVRVHIPYDFKRGQVRSIALQRVLNLSSTDYRRCIDKLDHRRPGSRSSALGPYLPIGLAASICRYVGAATIAEELEAVLRSGSRNTMLGPFVQLLHGRLPLIRDPADEASLPPTPSDLVIVRHIAKSIYEAREKSGILSFALKTIATSDASASRSKRSLEYSPKILMRLKHSHLVKILGIHRMNDGMQIIMPLITGDLQALLKTHSGHLDEVDNKDIAQQMSSALQYLHNQDILHRDIKPSNILVFTKQLLLHVQLADFGLSAISQASDPMTTFCGTYGYCAPEVWKGVGQTFAMDI